MSLPSLPRGLRASTAADPAAYSRSLCADGLGDGLPVLLPTEARVAMMLAGRDRAAAVGTLPPLFREFTVEDLAVCAVLAGCGPEHLAALIAAVTAVQQPEFNLLGVATTTGTTAVGLMLHGPYTQQVDANSGSNCMGPGNHTNATLGRALAMVLRAGGMIPGSLDMSTMGQPAKYGFCFAEAARAGFPSYCESIGLDREAPAVSVFATSGSVEVVDSHSDTATGLLETLASALPLPATANADGTVLGSGDVLVVIPPEWADRLLKDGVTAGAARELLHRLSTIPVDRLAPSEAGSLDPAVRSLGRVSTARSPDHIALVVSGGIGTKATYLPSWQGGSTITTALIR